MISLTFQPDFNLYFRVRVRVKLAVLQALVRRMPACESQFTVFAVRGPKGRVWQNLSQASDYPHNQARGPQSWGGIGGTVPPGRPFAQPRRTLRTALNQLHHHQSTSYFQILLHMNLDDLSY
jgi:hypothetical protein